MNNREIIAKLYDLSNTLDQQEQYRYSDDIQKLATRLAILNLPPQRLDHPGTYDLKTNHLEPLPPQNLLETLYQDFAGYGKPIPKVRLPFFPETKIDWTPDKFFADVIRDFEGTGHINNDFQNLLIQSSKFVNLLHDYVFVKNDGNTRLKQLFKEMIEKGEFALTYQLRKEFKKLKKYYQDSHKTNISNIVPVLIRISEILPTELLSEVQAMNEWLIYQRSNELKMLNTELDVKNAYEPKFDDVYNARQELRDYLRPTDEELENLQRTSISKMNKRQIVASLNKIANQLDTAKLHNEADTITKVMSRIAMDENDEYNTEDYGICPDCDEYLNEDGSCFDCGYGKDENFSNRNLTNGLDEISSMMDMHGNHPADKLREDYSKDYNNPTRSEMGDVFSDLDRLVVDNMTMNDKQKRKYEIIKKEIMNAFGS